MYLPCSKEGALYVQQHFTRKPAGLLGLFFLFFSLPVIILHHLQIYTAASDELLCGKQDKEKGRAYANDGLRDAWESLFSSTVKICLATRLVGYAEKHHARLGTRSLGAWRTYWVYIPKFLRSKKCSPSALIERSWPIVADRG